MARLQLAQHNNYKVIELAKAVWQVLCSCTFVLIPVRKLIAAGLPVKPKHQPCGMQASETVGYEPCIHARY